MVLYVVKHAADAVNPLAQLIILLSQQLLQDIFSRSEPHGTDHFARVKSMT